MASFPFDVWGKVSSASQGAPVEKMQVVPSPGGGYLVLTVENGSVFDVWLETLEEVEATVAEVDIEWPST